MYRSVEIILAYSAKRTNPIFRDVFECCTWSDAAEESIEDIRNQLNDGTKMVFITAGMGGGTGTGAAPVIARIAKEMDILTVGIVTIPFIFEGEKKIIQALDGVERIAQHVDALLVINNERLREIYADLTFMNAFGKADDTLSIAAKSIAEIITMRGTVNLDFADVKTILKDGGVAIMSTGFGEGENRVTKAIDDALHSPLLNNNDIFNAKKVMLNVSFCPSSELMMEEMNEIHEFMSKFREGVEVIWGVAIDNSLETNPHFLRNVSARLRQSELQSMEWEYGHIRLLPCL